MSLRGWLLCALVLLQGADVLLTWRLLTGRADVEEANPVAVAVLDSHGWGGAALLKVSSTVVALGCVLVVGRKREVFGRALLAGLCGLMAAVVGYSAALLARPEDRDATWLAHTHRVAATLDDQRAAVNELARERDEACTGLVAGRLGLPEAVGRMARQLRQHRGRLTPHLRVNWPSADRPDQVAAYLVRHCGSEGPRVLRLRDQLARHYPGARVGALVSDELPEGVTVAQ